MSIAPTSEGFLTLLKKRNFLRLWLAQLISMTILNASNYALLILINSTTHSTTLVGLAIISFSLPAILFGAPAGVFVDHMNKRRVLWSSNCLRALATFVFVAVLLLKRDSSVLVPVYLLTFIISCIGQFFSPAEGSAIPMLVSEQELMPALSLFNITFMLSQALGFVLLAPISISLLPTLTLYHVPVDSITQLYAIVALLYLVCALLILSIPSTGFVRRDSSDHAEAVSPALSSQTLNVFQNVLAEMVQGWRFVRKNNALYLAVIQLSFAGVLILVIGQLATPIVTELLHLPSNAMAFVFAPAGVGLVLGSILMPNIARRLGKSRTIFIGSIGLTIATLLMPLCTLLARWLQPYSWNNNPLLLVVIALLMFFAGLALDFINIPAQTAIQEMTPDWIKGRVLALQLVLYNACSIPIILFIGAFSDTFGTDRVLYMLAVCELAFGAWSTYYERRHPPQRQPVNESVDEETLPRLTIDKGSNHSPEATS
ncbi:MAG: MFS transporter [Ktedonobacteraceae bacterium]|nr:MFS transporter [Ktedonobacteraceae bacterium]